MSFCRWSTGDYVCDLYCYESSLGFETHVGSRRREYKEPLPPCVPFEDEEAWVRRLLAVRNLEEGQDYRLVKIGLPYDGQSFIDATLKDFISRLEVLRAAGYKFPVNLIEELREEVESI